uniref:Uncharacterized protein n=1 Tax=Romanomermis culicivorax TaxID=13658 RepID=A0A915KEX9_ROMCU
MMKSLKNYTYLPLNVKAACLLLHDFLDVSSQFPAVSKQISLEKGARLLIQILKMNSYDEHILVVLKSFMRHYSAVCYRHRTAIMKYLSKLFDVDCQKLTLRASECFALLPLIGPAGEKRVKYVENWNSFFRFITIAMHDTLHELNNVLDRSKINCQFDLRADNFKGDFTSDLKLSKLDTTRASELKNRMDFCCLILSALLENDLPPVNLPISALIHYFSCFSDALRHHKQLRNDISKTLSDCLPQFCRFFAKIVRLTKFNLIPYSQDILFSVESVFHHFSQTEDYSNEAKISFYDLLADLSLYTGAPFKLFNLIWKLWPQMKVDLQLETIHGSNKKENSNIKQENKKKRKKVRESDIMEVDYGDQFISKKLDFSVKCRLINEICKFLSVSSQKFAYHFKPSLYRDLQQFVCKLLMEILNTDENNPYRFDQKCTVVLLDLLLNLILSKNPGCPPAVLCAAEIFDKFNRYSCDQETLNLCSKAFSILDNITKPRVPSLENKMEFDFDNGKVAPELEKEEDNEQIISKLNEILNPHNEGDQQAIHSNGNLALPMEVFNEKLEIRSNNDDPQEPIVININDEEVINCSNFETPQPTQFAPKPTKLHVKDDSSQTVDDPKAKKLKLDNFLITNNQKEVNRREQYIGSTSEGKSYGMLGSIDDLIADFVDAPIEDENAILVSFRDLFFIK